MGGSRFVSTVRGLIVSRMIGLAVLLWVVGCSRPVPAPELPEPGGAEPHEKDARLAVEVTTPAPEDTAAEFVNKEGGEVIRDDKRPGRPVVGISLRNTPVTDAGLKGLAALNDLTALDLSGTTVTSAGLKELAPLTHLTSLRLDPAQVTDRALAALRDINLLHALTRATAAHGTRPAKSEGVTSLDLRNTPVTDAGLKELARLRNLTTLHLWDTKVTDAGLTELAPLKNLTTLELSIVTDRTLAVLREIDLLHALTRATAANGNRPAKSGEVITLNLRDTKVTGAGLTELAPLKHLTTLRLDPGQLTDGALAALREIGLLHALSGATDAKGNRPTRSEEVTALTLRDTKLTGAGLKELVAFKNLTTLVLSGKTVTDADVKELAALNALTILYLRGTSVTDAGVKDLQKALPKCRIER